MLITVSLQEDSTKDSTKRKGGTGILASEMSQSITRAAEGSLNISDHIDSVAEDGLNYGDRSKGYGICGLSIRGDGIRTAGIRRPFQGRRGEVRQEGGDYPPGSNGSGAGGPLR